MNLSPGQEYKVSTWAAASRSECPGWLEPPQWLAPAFLLLVFGYLVFLGVRVNWIPWTSDCNKDAACYPGPGETISTIVTARYYVVDGPRYWYIQELPGSTPGSPPLLYTHNVNIGAFAYYLSSFVTANPFGLSVIFSMIGFCVGMYYGYLFVRRLSGSSSFGMIFLMLMGSSYYFNLPFAFNLIRSWHWLALFGGAYHLIRGFETAGRAGRAHFAAFVAYSILAFTIGYDFVAIPFCLSLILAFVAGQPASQLSRLKRVVLVVSAYAFPFILRQIQVMGGLGFKFWATDLYYSAVIKTSFLNTIFPLPPLPAIDAWYHQQRVLRPIAFPEDNVLAIVARFLHYLWLYWYPYLGFLTTVIVVAGVVLALFLAIFPHVRRSDEPKLTSLSFAARTVIIMGAAEALGLYFFAPLSLDIYLKHRFPLVIAFVLLVYGFMLYVPICLIGTLIHSDRTFFTASKQFAAGLLLTFLVAARVTDIGTEYQKLVLSPRPSRLLNMYIVCPPERGLCIWVPQN